MPESDKKELSEELQSALKSIVDEFISEEYDVRERQIRLWKKLELYWNGFQRVWWDSVAHDWRVYNQNTDQSLSLQEAANYDKPINIYRGFLETIISALSTIVPPVKCIPDDADNANDVATARGGTKISELIYKQNNAPLLWVRALWIFYTQGMVAAYNYTSESEDFGQVDVDEYEDAEETQTKRDCPTCGTELVDDYCPECEVDVDNPTEREEKILINKYLGKVRKSKSRQVVDINGGLFVRIPNYARTQKDSPYLAYCYETHYSNVWAKYPWLRGNVETTTNPGEDYEQWGRLNLQYYGEYPRNTPTVNNWWLRPRAFEMVKEEHLRDELKELFPTGVKVVFINEVFAEAIEENLDKHWTVTFNPLSEYIQFDPTGLLLTPIQDIINELVSLTLQIIEHGVPQTFADPSVLNFEQYRNTDVEPGMIFPAKARSGKNLAEGFHTVVTASMGNEVESFFERMTKSGEFVSGAMPSLFGGALPSSARTASQYQLSRGQALQRLQIVWKMFTYWWQEIFGKVIPDYIENMLTDERIVREQNNVFINDIIKKSDLNGKIGEVTLEASEEIPITSTQKRDALLQLLDIGIPQLAEALVSPENLELLQEVIGITNFKIPGDTDREKQYYEIQQLTQAEPIEVGPEQFLPSIEPDKDIDNHIIHIKICQYWLSSAAGLQAKEINTGGYENVKAHMKAHMMLLQPLLSPTSPGQQGSSQGPQNQAQGQPQGVENGG